MHTRNGLYSPIRDCMASLSADDRLVLYYICKWLRCKGPRHVLTSSMLLGPTLLGPCAPCIRHGVSVCVQKVLCIVEFMSVPQWIYAILSSMEKLPYPRHTLCSLPHCAYCLFILVCLCMVTLYNPSGTSGSFKAHPVEGFRPRVVLSIATKMHVLVTNL